MALAVPAAYLRLVGECKESLRRLAICKRLLSQIPMEDYIHATQVWNDLSIDRLGEYSSILLKTDVFLLAQVFEAYRDSDQKTYGLDPYYYYTTPDTNFAFSFLIFTYFFNPEFD